MMQKPARLYYVWPIDTTIQTKTSNPLVINLSSPFRNNFYSHQVPPPRTSDEEMKKALEIFLKEGGKIQEMRDDSGSYNKNLKKTQKNLAGGFNPFSKTQALTINKGDFK